MTKKLKFTFTTAWILLTRSYDAYCTNQLTPDLSKESNPLVSILGMTWTPLLITLALLTIYVIYAYYISAFKPIDLLPTEKGYSFSMFTAFVYLGYKDKWTSVFYKFPNDINRFNQYMGNTLTQCLVFAGFVSTVMWLLIHHSEYYRDIHSAPFIYGILIVGSMLIIYRWNTIMYSRYLLNTNNNL
jgi:hypothetical protein